MSFINVLLVAAALVAVTNPASAAMPAIPEIPTILPDEMREPLIERRQPLAQRKLALIEKGNTFTQACAKVEKGTPKFQNCAAELAKFNADVDALTVEMEDLAYSIQIAVREHTINSMNAMAERLKWGAEERTRLDAALNQLDADGAGAEKADIVQAWSDVLARGQNSDLARKASGGDGPGFASAGRQSFEDCAVFALANAAGLPYGVVAARATELIRGGAWRDAAARANPQRTIEKAGLTGGEVIMLAEAFGEAEVIRSEDFAKTLQEGRPVMVNIVPQDGDAEGGHEVVLTKAFQHDGGIWYEMVDSNQGPSRRLYVSADELHVMLKENGVAFRPEAGTTPRLLR